MEKGVGVLKRVRRIHLWIGLISSLFIFLEALTGLLLMEPRLIGGNPPIEQRFGDSGGSAVNTQNIERAVQGNGVIPPRESGTFQRDRENFGIMGIIRGLHVGRIGNINVSWLTDLVAVAMMLLSGTGIYLSLKILRAERRRKFTPQSEENGV
ncbi:hypothetical protein CVV65_01440 [Kyrpidia spormannii]|uniref:PepSY domain-containing protein n=1 Tax=Kyrpidia spormannii TaxID=2055160 RepID=A0A2K8N2Q8_9BACL|nr:PepSY-associated TM helix domain-containing protein [Kyrpidia spormannii]ATY83804.1 hypothetical protein CVV65_01440 [Kyrpidia spormannii]